MSQDIAALLKCSCGTVELELRGSPAGCGFCHCSICRDFYGLPIFSVTSWKREAVVCATGDKHLGEFVHRTKQMRRYFCLTCGETLFGINRLGMAVVGTSLIAKAFAGELPVEFRPTFHLFYTYRVFNVEDGLPKYLEGRSGPLHQKPANTTDA